MSITIDNPTAESIYAALKQMPPAEITRLRAMLNDSSETIHEEEAAWYQASEASLARFFEEEEKY